MYMKLGDLCDITIGRTPSRNNPKYWGEGYKWVSISDMDKKFICQTKEQITEKAKSECNCTILPKGTLIMSFKLSIGKLSFLEEDMCTNEAIAGLIIKDKSIIFNKYLYYALKVLDLTIGGDRAVKGITLNKEKLTNIMVYLPSYNDQVAIVEILDKAQALIDKRKQAIVKLDELVQAVFLDMFGDPIQNQKGWPLRPFSNFAKIDTTMTTDFDFYSEYPHIGIENIERDTGELVNFKLVKEQQLSSGKYLFNENHIIYSKIRPYLNKVAIPEFSGLCSADSYPILVDTDKTNRTFFAYMLRSKRFLIHVEGLSTRTNIPKVNKSQLQSFECPCPPLYLQNDFSNMVTTILNSKRKMKLQLQQLESNFQALLQKAFKGELKVKDGVEV